MANLARGKCLQACLNILLPAPFAFATALRVRRVGTAWHMFTEPPCHVFLACLKACFLACLKHCCSKPMESLKIYVQEGVLEW